MMTPNTCHTCAAFEPLTNECRRRAPLPMTLVMFDASVTVNASVVWPVVKPDYWCWEWAENPKPLPDFNAILREMAEKTRTNALPNVPDQL